MFQRHEVRVGTANGNGLTSDQVLGELRRDLLSLGFDVEEGKRRSQKILRPVFFGENGITTVLYEIDGYHPEWQCGLEIEAGRAWMGNAVYRNLITACVMVQVDHLVLAVPNAYRYKTAGRLTISKDYDKTVSLAEALYGHSRLALPYDLVVIGY